jgi:poly(A)-specific ribonuclease
MEIVRSNFLQFLPQISEAIEAASFFAIDAEFSGLNTKWKLENAIDSPQERYTKLMNTSKDFIIIQFGLCAFTLDIQKNCYIAKPFNFYIFPRHLTRESPDVRFLCQSSSIDFLVGHNFDFNKWVREGISYLRPCDEEKLRNNFQERHEQSFGPFTSPATFPSPAGSTASSTKSAGSLKTPVIVPPEHKPFVEKACSEIEEMLKNPESKTTSLPPCNGYLRKLIYQSAKQRFTSGIQLEKSTNEKKECFIVVTKVDEDERKKFEEKKQSKEKEVVENAVGFSAVMKMVSQSGKLIVGHNMLLDLLHVVHQFCCPLPEEVDEFKAIVQALYPRIIDTKVMATTQPFRDHLPSTILGDLVNHLFVAPFTKPAVELDQEFSRYKGSEKLHEAAYDAYITGLSFISMANYLGSFQDPPKSRISPESTLVSPFVNKIFLFRMEDIPYLNLAGEDLTPSRDHVFFLTFPNTWKYGDILDLFSPFGFVYVSWVNDVSAFVSLAI